jgi:DNA-binding beta-propeller fold protein YncE
MPSHRFRKSTCFFFAIIFLLCVPARAKAVESQAPVTLLTTTYLPEITGDFDHFAVDLKRNHLFVSAEVHHSVEMFDLKTGTHLQSISGFKAPHSVGFAPEKDELLVADGGDSALILLSGDDFHRIDRVQLIDGSATGKGDSPDAAYYDAANRLYYIGNGGVSANLSDSEISVFSVDQGKLIDKISIPGNNVESMGIDLTNHSNYLQVHSNTGDPQFGTFFGNYGRHLLVDFDFLF